MKTDIKIMAFDLDGTLLTRDKRLTERNVAALRRAAAEGIEIVPCTGRYFGALPKEVMELGIVNYVITINGSYIYDLKNQRVIATHDMSYDTAMGVMDYLDTVDTVYDCYYDNTGWMTQSSYDKVELYADAGHVEMIRRLRTPVPSIRDFLADGHKSVQKIQFFMNDNFEKLLATGNEVKRLFPNTSVASSVKFNVEINDIDANKGTALKTVAEYLGVPIEQTMGFGDGGNDFDMQKAAGVFVAMENGRDDLKTIADVIAPDCDESGCGVIIEKVLNGEEL